MNSIGEHYKAFLINLHYHILEGKKKKHPKKVLKLPIESEKNKGVVDLLFARLVRVLSCKNCKAPLQITIMNKTNVKVWDTLPKKHG